MKKFKKNKGFGLIGVIIALAVIILVGAGFYWKETRNQESLLQSGNDALQKVKERLLKAKIEQRQLTNEIGTSTVIAVTTNKIDTSSWKTYSNVKYKISFKYPPNFLIIENYDQYGKSYYYNIYFFASLLEKREFEECNYAVDCFYSSFDISFQIIPNLKQVPLREFLREWFKGTYTVGDNYDPLNYLSTQVDGFPALQDTFRFLKGKGIVYNIYVDRGKTVFRIGANIDKEFINLGAEQILSTFKFIK